MPQFVMTAITSMLFGRIAARIPLHALMVAGFGLIGAMLAVMAGFGAGTAYGPVGVALAVLGVGMVRGARDRHDRDGTGAGRTRGHGVGDDDALRQTG